MTGEKVGRGYRRNLDAGPFQPMIDSFELHLRAECKSAKTVRTYVEAAPRLAAGHLVPAGLTDWPEVRVRDVQQWIVTLIGHYSYQHANSQHRALQQFFRWYATEDPDDL
jgi:hypothetical protein